MTLDEIKQKLQEIIEKLSNAEDMTEEEIQELEDKANELEEEKKSLIARAEKRKATLDKVKRGFAGTTIEKVEDERKEKIKMNEEREILNNAEYRSAFLKRLQGKKLTESEERAMTSASESVGAVIPTVTQDLVMEKLEESAPLLNEIELMRVNGNVTFAVEADKTDANIHEEGATITEDGDVLIPVSLTTYEITKQNMNNFIRLIQNITLKYENGVCVVSNVEA